MGQAAHRSLDTTNHHRHIGIQLLEDIAIGDRAIIWTHTCPTLGCVGIVRAQTLGSCIVVHHRVHTARGNGKEQPWATQLGKISMVTTPIGLWHDCYAIACCLQHTTYHRRAKSGMIYIRIAREEDHIHFVPPAELQFLFGGWQICFQVVHHSSLYATSLGYT